MNWSNQGAYRVNFWKDDDYSTHKWHIDHNIPQSWLPYFSMDDFNFKICWHKLNLQPLSAKENIIQNNNIVLNIVMCNSIIHQTFFN